MTPFTYHRAATASEAAQQAGAAGKYLGGGTNLVDLMRETIERPAALVEPLRPARFDDNDPDLPGAAANPTTYAALRTATALYVEYASGEVSYYDLARDPFALKNVAASLAAAEKTRLHNQLYAFVQCRGATACWEAGRLTVAATAPPFIAPWFCRFEATLQIRNKVIKAYEDIRNMPI